MSGLTRRVTQLTCLSAVAAGLLVVRIGLVGLESLKEESVLNAYVASVAASRSQHADDHHCWPGQAQDDNENLLLQRITRAKVPLDTWTPAGSVWVSGDDKPSSFVSPDDFSALVDSWQLERDQHQQQQGQQPRAEEGGDARGVDEALADEVAIKHELQQIVVWWTDEELGLRLSWQFVFRELLGDMPMTVTIQTRTTVAQFADAANMPGFHLFAIKHEFLQQVLALGLTSQYGLWIINNESNELPVGLIPPKVSIVIHPYFFDSVFVDPRFVWIPTGYFLDRVGGGRHTYLRSSQRRTKCWFMGSVKEKTDTRQKFFASMAQVEEEGEDEKASLCQIDQSSGFGKGLLGYEYALKMMDVTFALCPGGYSVETLRLYEALENGAIPVMVQADYDRGRFDLTHPYNQFVVVPSWPETFDILLDWLDPAETHELDLLQQRNLDWYDHFKRSVGLHLRSFIVERVFNNTIDVKHKTTASTS